jgi:AcrR family transcriptional regulator
MSARRPQTRKITQRERMLAAMLELANSDGYAAASVSRVIERAGVSRPTFYEYFADKDACFVATHRDSGERLLAQIDEAIAQAPPERAAHAAVRRLLQRAEAEPGQARFMAIETMAGGPRALDERDRTIREIARSIDRAVDQTPPRTPAPDLPTRGLIGAAHWMLSPRLRRSEHDFTALADELDEWIESYNRPAGEHRWRMLEPGPEPPPSPYLSELATRPPAPLRAGRSRLPETEIARNQRERILHATAQVAPRKGYSATTIADITSIAKLDRRVFYKHFRDKQQAFLAVHELAFQQTMAVAASAFFSTASWEERIWHGIHAASQFNAVYPSFAHIGYVEAHAIGAPAVQRVDDTRQAFAVFLQEGSQHTGRPPSQIAMEAIVTTVFEIGYEQFRHGNAASLTRFSYHATYLCLAPFLGQDAANAFIDGKLREAPGRQGK